MTNAEIDNFFREQLARVLRETYQREYDRLKQEVQDVVTQEAK